jgi:hypothetical protein
MPGASDQTQRVKALNANWAPDPVGGDGRFEIMVVTEDDQIHTMAASAASVTAIVSLVQADTVMVWDPENRPGLEKSGHFVGLALLAIREVMARPGATPCRTFDGAM